MADYQDIGNNGLEAINIEIAMSKRDADRVQEIFDRDVNACFTVTNKYTDEKYPDLHKLEIMCESATDLWYLAKEVEMLNSFDDRMEKIKNKVHKSFGI